MGTGDIYSTVEDLFKFHLSITNHTLLNKELIDAMLSPGKLQYNNYGFGWFNQIFKYTETDSIKVNFHLGSTNGFISFALRIPATNSFIVFLCNSYPTDFFGITKNLIKVLYHKPVHLKEPMETLISQLGVNKAVEQYNKMKKDTAHYYVDWISMNFMSEQLLTLKRLEDAKVIAENNVIEFPDKALVMVTMGNIYLALNRKEDAIKYYKMTLQLNPDYEEAKSRLRELVPK